MKHSHKIRSLFLTAILFLGLLPILSVHTEAQDIAAQASHSHPVCDDYCSCGGGHADVSWTAFPSGVTTLSSGHYYLDTAVTGSNTITVTGDVSICLNGKKLTNTTSSHVFYVKGSGTLTICDCVGGGTITNTKVDLSGQSAIDLYDSSSMILYGGTVNGAQFDAIFCNTTGDLQIHGGKVTAASNGINIYEVDELTISAGTISATSGSAVSCEYGRFRNITVSGGTLEGMENGIQFGQFTCTGRVQISGGTLNGKGPVPSGTTYAGHYYGLTFMNTNGDSCNLTISGGTLLGARGGFYNCNSKVNATVSGGTLRSSKSPGIFATSGSFQITGGAIYGMTAEGPVTTTMTDGELLYTNLYSASSGSATLRVYGGTVGRIGSNTTSIAISNSLMNPKYPIVVDIYGGTVVGTSYAIRSVSKCSVSLSGGTLSGGTAEIYLGETTASASGAYLSLNGYTGLPVTVEVPSSAAVGTYIARKVPADGLIILKSNTNSALYDTKNSAVKINGPHTHTYGSWIGEVSATCSKPGTLGHKDCTICYGHFDASGNELTDLTIPIDSNNHVNTSIYPQQDATCTQEGYTAGAYCNSCSTWVLGHEVIAPSHSWVDATCIAPKSCSVCGATEGEPAGHAPIPHEGKASTCTEAGWEDYETCENCDYSTFQALPLADHTPGAAVVENRKESTCTVKGSYDSVVYCIGCPKELSREAKELPLAEHSYVEGICSVCGWIEGLEYEIRDGKAFITGFTGPATAFDLPGTIEDCPVTTICESAFENVSHLTYVGIPENVTTIEAYAFWSCENLEQLSIPSTLKTVGYAFGFSSNLTRVDISDLRAWLEIEFSHPESNPLASGCGYLYLNDQLVRGEVAVPDDTARIGSNAFYGYSLITGVTVPDGVASIGSGAFNSCENLKRVSIAGSVKEIGLFAFNNCTALEELSLGSGIQKIQDYAFRNCENLETVTIPDTVTYIGQLTFAECSSLQKLHIPGGVTNLSDDAFWDCISLKELTVAEGVVSIGREAFAFCSELQTVKLPSTVTSIKADAFQSCYVLESIELPENLTTIGANAFSNCYTLNHVRIPDGVMTVGAGAFRECNSLETVVIPDSVLTIGKNAFTNTNLKDIYYEGTDADWSAYGTSAPTAEFIHYQCTEPDGHWYAGSTNSTCTEAGYSYDTCDCGYEKNRQEIPKLPHTEVVDEAVAATCTEDGKTEGKHCDLCGTVTKAQEVVEATGHKEVTDAAVAATCTKDGKTEGKHCSVCGTVTKAQETVKAAGHKEVTDKAVAATCTKDGKTEGKHCSVCNTVIKAQETVKATGHKEVTDKAVAATCTKDGKTEGKHCSVCGTVTKAQETVKATGHKEVTDAAVAATCTTDGLTEGKHCSVCGTVTKAQETVKATGHSFQNGKCGICGEKDPDYVEPTEPEVKTVTRVFGEDRYATSFKAADTLKAELGVEKFQNVIVASGTGFADALAGSYLAAVKEAPILLVRSANVNAVKDYIKSNLASGGTVYLLGGVNAVPQTMETGLDGFNVKRLGGADRYDTNLLILKEAGVGNKDIIVCTGLNFADSLSASASGLPILLVKGGLTDTQKAFLKGTSGKKIIVGGTSAVSGTVESQLKTYGSVKRLAGDTRYDTSVLVAKEFFSAPKAAVLAYAQNFPDGLSGGPLAYTLKAPLILTDNKKPAPAVAYATGLGIKSGYVLGGTGLISDKVVKNVFSMTADDTIILK